jgi:hypothetical protein
VEPKVLGDETTRGQEPLGVTRGLEPVQVSLPLAGGLVWVLGAVRERAVLVMIHPWKNLALGGPIALQFVGDDHAGDVGQ